MLLGLLFYCVTLPLLSALTHLANFSTSTPVKGFWLAKAGQTALGTDSLTFFAHETTKSLSSLSLRIWVLPCRVSACCSKRALLRLATTDVLLFVVSRELTPMNLDCHHTKYPALKSLGMLPRPFIDIRMPFSDYIDLGRIWRPSTPWAPPMDTRFLLWTKACSQDKMDRTVSLAPRKTTTGQLLTCHNLPFVIVDLLNISPLAQAGCPQHRTGPRAQTSQVVEDTTTTSIIKTSHTCVRLRLLRI